MAQLLAAVANDAEYMPSLLYSLGNVLIHPAPGQTADVWGVGYYTDERALVIHKPGALMTEREFYDLAREVKSHSIMAVHESHATAGMQAAAPYRFRHFLFGAVGDLTCLEALRERVTDALPGFIRTELGARSPGELAFGMFVRALHDKGALTDPLIGGDAVADAMTRTAETIANLADEAGVPAPEASYAATNGRVTTIHQNGPAVHYKLQEGLEALPDGPPDPAMTDFKSVVAALKRFRALVVAAEVDDAGDAWTQVGAGRTLWVDRRLAITVG